jgi:hypothetical protein
MTEPHAAPEDQAMGLELQAIELESELEWAEAQGRTGDARTTRLRLIAVLDELAALADHIAA